MWFPLLTSRRFAGFCTSVICLVQILCLRSFRCRKVLSPRASRGPKIEIFRKMLPICIVYCDVDCSQSPLFLEIVDMSIVEFDGPPFWSIDATPAMPSTTPTQGYFVSSPVSFASRDQNGGPSNSTINIYDLTENIRDCEQSICDASPGFLIRALCKHS